MIAAIVIVVLAVFAAAYLLYGRFLSRQVKLDDTCPTPAVQINDGVDFVPARASLLLGQHFSAIAAAGPIVGPILAGLYYGWLPALLWIVLGAIFIGGVHDFSSLVASVRHRGASIAQVVRQNMSRPSYLLFLSFIWVALVYVIIAFADLTANTFKTAISGEAFGPAVAASSILYLLAGVLMGVLLYKFRAPLLPTTLIFVPLVLLIVWLGPNLPAPILNALGGLSAKQWDMILLGYCFLASVLPMWLLLQPRGYLGGWLLYLTLAVGLVGALGGEAISSILGLGPAQAVALTYPAFGSGQPAPLPGGLVPGMLPFLFITVACGACSGFHGIVSSGTTSKQLARETDARRVGYGAMLLEGMVAVLALTTVMVLPAGKQGKPDILYAEGIARYLGLFGLPTKVGLAFALLAFSTFIYDTLDVCTRLARYIFQELTGLKGLIGGFLATAATLAVPLAFFLLVEKADAWRVAWNIFGASNQLLASLTLMAVAVWLAATGRKTIYVTIPMAFMMVMALWSLAVQAWPLVRGLLSGQAVDADVVIVGVAGIVLLSLSLLLLVEAARFLISRRKANPPKSPQTLESATVEK